MKKLSIICLLLLHTLPILGQSSKPQFFQGYEEDISGMRFGYHSPLPDVKKSLLVRGQSNYAPIVWKGEAIPKSYKENFVHYIWIFGMDVTADPVDFQLNVNDVEFISFQSSKRSKLGEMKFKGREGSELILNVTMLDNTEDQMGFAILKIPVKAIKKGKQTQFKISAKPEDNAAWFMTFKSNNQEKTDIYQNKVVAKRESMLYHSISIDFIHLGTDANVIVTVGETTTSAILKPGFNKVEMLLPKVAAPTKLSAQISKGDGETVIEDFTLSPIKEWKIYLVQHTHSDIGYTRPQTEILPEHLRYIDHALDYCDQTDDYPDDAKFRWTCETSWSVREYLRSRPQSQIDRLVKRIQEGRIEATGMFFNFSEIADESALIAQTKTLKMLKNSGIDVTTAMQNDVNGIAWCLVDYFKDTDVKYLTMGIHAHRARKPFDKPTTFWWQSPAGNRLLAYRSEHYMHGNALSLTSGQQDVFRTNLSEYLKSLEDRNYPYNELSLQFSGYITDNSPPSMKVCDIIKEWNEKYEWPKLRSALAKDFMIYLDEKHSQKIPVHEVAWPDWWTDGVGSAANETKVVRNTHVEIATSTALLAMARMNGIELPDQIHNDIELVYDNLLFYDEHTHGAAESVSDPLAQNTINQWGMKSSYAWEAAKRSTSLQEKALAFIQPILKKSDKPTIAVFNTLNWKRSGMAELFIDYETIPFGIDFTITDSEDEKIPYQIFMRRTEGAYYGIWIEDIPPMGYKTLQINLGAKTNNNPASQSLENKFYKLTINKSDGVISQIFDKELQTSLIDPTDSLSLGMLIYEELRNRHELERLTNTNRDTVYRPLDLSRKLMSNISLTKVEQGQIFKSIFLNGDLPVCADDRGVSIEIRLFNHQKKIELHYSMHKLPVYTPEGVYAAFPFKLPQGKLEFEAQGGIVNPGENQLEGSSSDWNTIQNYAAVKNENAQIIFTSDDIPLVQFGDINIGRYYYRLRPKTNHIYSWVLNNYWVTNFKASQLGELRWRYGITSSSDNSTSAATRFGWNDRVPLISRVLLPSKESDKTILEARSLINLDISNLLLVNSTISLDGRGIILLLRELEGKETSMDLEKLKQETGAKSIEEVSVLEESLQIPAATLSIGSYETKFVKLNFD